MDDPERGVTILDAVGDHTHGDEVVHLLELDLLALQFLTDAPQPFDAPVDLDHGHLRLGQFCGQRLLELLDEAFGRAPLRIHLHA